MGKLDSVILLIDSLSKAEKKHLSVNLIKGEENKDYVFLYELIHSHSTTAKENIKKEYLQYNPKGAFEITLHYLYEKLIDSLLDMRRKKDIRCILSQKINAARMMYERSMFNECFILLQECINLADQYEYYDFVLIAQKMELEYLLRLDFPNITEQELYHKQYLQNEALKKNRKIIEQSSLYGLLRHRIIYKGNIRTDKQKKEMSDLMVSELYLSASSGTNNFEIKKNHQLFQASYLINEGNYTMALNSYKELNKLFENNPQFLSNPPIYYLFVLEGTLSNLRTMGLYKEIPYYLRKLEKLTLNTSMEFQMNITSLIFQYEIIPYLDSGNFTMCLPIVKEYEKSLFEKMTWLNPIRKSELFLYTALIQIGLKHFKEARKLINNILFDTNIDYLPIMRTVRIVRLIIYYELEEFELISYETRSIKRKLSLKKESSFRIEHKMLWFLNKQLLPVLSTKRKELWEKLKPEFDEFHNSRYENQLLRIFDFTAWVESKILRKDLAIVMAEHFNNKMEKANK